jgi:CHAT domain-containing protein
MPALSPDGKWIAYVSRANKNYDIWVKPAAGGLATQLTTHTSDDYSPTWSPDGRSLAFISRRDDAEGDLYLLQLKHGDGTLSAGKIKLLKHNLDREAFPAFSPDGKKIAFSLGAAGAEQIWLYEFKTQKKYPLTKQGGTQPAWSPDGKQLAISCPVATGNQIFIISADTAEADRHRQQITFTGDNQFPSWSPDGQKLLVQRFETNDESRRDQPNRLQKSHLRLITLPPATASATANQELQITPSPEGALFPFWGKDHAIYYAAEHYKNFDLWRIPETGLIPRRSTPQESFTSAQEIEDPKLALLAFSALRFYFPDSALWLSRADLEIGRRFQALGDTAKAKTIFAQVAQEHAGRFEAAAFAEIELAKLQHDLKRFSEISARNNAWPAAQAFCALEIGKALQREGKIEAALQHFKTIPEKYPNIAEACYDALRRTGDILVALGRNDAGEAAYLQIVTAYRERQDWRSTAITRLLDGPLQSAIAVDTLAAYQRVTQKYLAYPAVAHAARYRIAERLFRDGENKLAANEYQNLIALLENQPDVYLQHLRAAAMLQLMRLHIRDNEFPAAAQIYLTLYEQYAEQHTAGEARRELTEALIRRARLLARVRDDELALALFQQARQYDPRNLEAHRGYVEAKQALGDIDEAVAEYEKQTTAAPDNEVALYALGLAYSYKGENNVGLLRHSAEIIARALGMNYRLIPAYLTLGFNYEAIENLEQKERARRKGFLERVALALPLWLDSVRRTLTLRPPKPPARWYEKAIEVLTIAVALNDEQADPQMEARLALNLANNYYNLGEFGFENALRYYFIKLRHDSTFANARQQAIICERIGECGWVTRRYDEAAPFLQTAVRLCRELRDVDGELRNLQRLALLYQSKGDYDTSNEYYAKVDTVSRRENRQNDLALVWRNMAYNHQQNKESDEAITKSARSLALLAQSDKSNFPEPKPGKLTIKLLSLLPIFWMTIDPFGESNTEGLTYEQEKALLFSITGEGYVTEKDFRNAIDLFEKKAETFRRDKNWVGEARTLNNLGNLWYAYHDFGKAYEYFLRSFKLCDRLQLPAGKIVNLINMGNLALLQENETWRHAIDSLLQASAADLNQIGLLAPRQKLAALNMLGNFHFYAAQRSLPNPADLGAPSNGDLARGIERTYRALQNLSRAQAAYDTALTIAQTSRLLREEVIVRRNLASLYVLMSDYPLALEHLARAHAIAVAKNFAELTWRVEHAIGAICRAVQLPPENPLAQKSAAEWYRHAIQILESLPEEPEGSEQRLAETAEELALYENAVTLLAEQGEYRAALELAERARSNRFVNLISTRYILPKKERHRLIWGGGGGRAPYLQRAISRWRGELAKLEAEEPQRPKELARVRNELAAAESEYQDVVREALAEDPELASFFSIQSVDTQALQDSLDPETVILEYFVTENELIVWSITHESLAQTRVPITRQQLRERIATLRQAWQARRDDSAKLSRELSALLLGAVRGLDEFRRLIIVPDDGLHYLPFGALEYDGEPVVDMFAIAKAPSLLALKFAEQHKNLNAGNLLVVEDARANYQENAANLFDGRIASDSLSQQLSGIKVEMLRGADWRVGEARQKIQQAGLLHIQHRFAVQPQRPLDSGFTLQLAANQNAALIPLYRLFELDLSSSLVALENAAFPYAMGQDGDEIVALQRSLIYAGTPTLVCSQWQVEPAVREIFFKAFYKNLASAPAIAALSAAQHAVREKFSEPYYWAGFELAGFAGMSVAEKSQFANRNFEETVLKGNQAQELGEFADAARYYQSALAMAQQLGQNEAVQNLYLLIKSSAISGNDYATACEIETKILENAVAADDVRQMARSYRNLSSWQLQLKNYAAATAAEQKYLELAERVKNPLAIADSRLQLARILEASGDYVAALAQAELAAAILREQNQILPRFNAETFLGRLALEDDEYGAALNYLEQAVSAFLETRQPSTPAEQRALATAYQLTGMVYDRLTAYGQALAFHQKAFELFEAISDTVNLARAEQNLANTYWLNGDYQNALLHQQRSLKQARNSREKLLGQSTLGLILLSFGDFDKALDAEKQALQLALEIDEAREQATVYKNIGLVYVQKQQPQQALANFKQAAALDRQTDFVRGLLYDYLFLGQVFQTLGQPDSALANLAKAEVLALNLNDPRAHSKTLYTKGLTVLDRGNKSLARAAFTEALAKAEASKLEEMQWRCLWRLGALSRQSGELEPAVDFYTRAIAALERQSAKIKIEEYRSGFIDNKSDIYEEAVLLLLQMNRSAEAFVFAERAKSRSFADLLASGKIDLGAGADRKLLDRRDHLLDRISFTQGKINALLQKPATETGRFEMAALNDTLNALQKAYADILVELKAANPELADMVSVEPLPVTEAQAMLSDSVALVEYFFAKDQLVSWVVDRNQARAVQTPLDRNRLRESIVQFRRALIKRASTESFSRELYDLLVKPLEPLLTGAKQLVIVPHGVLHYLPFPALQKADSTYLIDRYALALAPSATVLGFCYRKGSSILEQAQENYRVLALGNPDVGNARFDLPFAEKEITSLEQTFSQIESYVRKQATPSALAAGTSRANLVHLSCHGVYDERNPLFSALLLAPDSTNATGRLEAFKIFGLKLNASLVMLSACETGLAKVTGGDEVIGLARGFIFAGTPSLIASLWTVDDLATAITVKRFYRYLKSGLSKAEALRQAQLVVRDQHNRHPAYWASFGLTGDWR